MHQPDNFDQRAAELLSCRCGLDEFLAHAGDGKPDPRFAHPEHCSASRRATIAAELRTAHASGREGEQARIIRFLETSRGRGGEPDTAPNIAALISAIRTPTVSKDDSPASHSPWRPIGSAPKDGSWFIGNDYGVIYPCAFDGEKGLWVSPTDGGGHIVSGVQPNLWMPLPVLTEAQDD